MPTPKPAPIPAVTACESETAFDAFLLGFEDSLEDEGEEEYGDREVAVPVALLGVALASNAFGTIVQFAMNALPFWTNAIS